MNDLRFGADLFIIQRKVRFHWLQRMDRVDTATSTPSSFDVLTQRFKVKLSSVLTSASEYALTIIPLTKRAGETWIAQWYSQCRQLPCSSDGLPSTSHLNQAACIHLIPVLKGLTMAMRRY
jgi:hypothetical protein